MNALGVMALCENKPIGITLTLSLALTCPAGCKEKGLERQINISHRRTIFQSQISNVIAIATSCLTQS